jgi:hypothetical protein
MLLDMLKPEFQDRQVLRQFFVQFSGKRFPFFLLAGKKM